MTRDEFISLLTASADRLGLDPVSRWIEVSLWRIELRRPGTSTPVLSVHLRTYGPQESLGMHVAFVRPGETVVDDLPVGPDGVPARDRHHGVRIGPGDGHREILAAFRAEARRAMGMLPSQAHEDSLRRAVADAMADDPDLAADLVASVMVEAGLGARLQVSLDERMNLSPGP